jgi:hypothetical protein
MFARKIVVEVEDIQAVYLKCNCGRQISWQPDSIETLTQKCKCGQKWSIGNDTPHFQFVRLMNTMMTARAESAPPPLGFKILLEFDEPR